MTDDDDLTRIGISLPKNLLEQFDEVLKTRNYNSRSEGIRDAIRIYTISYQWLENNHVHRRGIISAVYGVTNKNLLADIPHIRYENRTIIQVSLRTQVSANRRLEVFLVDGEGAQIRIFAEQLTHLNGIESVKVTTVPSVKGKNPEQGGFGWETGVQQPIADTQDKI